ncbi:MAG: cbb3-type cytochrome c oxidase subunit II, partial [Rhodospirillales bacterium]|nr:cbb3-type cytochrome c oxidase subunit II [Rhodospirillales bacterium]
LIDPRSVVPESIMPPYAFLAKRELSFDDAADHMKTLRIVGVPYSDEQIATAKEDLRIQGMGEAGGDVEAFLARYPKAKIGSFDGDAKKTTEMDALVAYLQMLGTLVDFTNVDPETLYR